MRLMRACGCGECRILPINIPGSDRSSVYLPAPVVLPAASTIAIGRPMMEKSGITLARNGLFSQQLLLQEVSDRCRSWSARSAHHHALRKLRLDGSSVLPVI